MMTFGEALKNLLNGARLAREGWNGKGMFVFVVQGSQFEVNREPLLSILGAGTPIDYSPHIDICFAPGKIAVWTPSQQDLFATDWQVVFEDHVKQTVPVDKTLPPAAAA